MVLLSVPFVFAQSAVNLGTAGNFAILSKSGITNVPTSAILGNVGTTPITGAAIGVTCAEVTGTIYSVNGAGPLPCRVINAGTLNTARIAMEAAYTDAAARVPPLLTGLGSGDISGMILTPGVYKWTTGLLINSGTVPDTNGVTLDCQGNSSAVFIFQIGQDLTVGSGAVVTLSNGCQASNIFWQVGGQATLGTTSVFNGNILSKTLIAMQTGAALCGRTLAQTAVTLDSNHISILCGSINEANPTLMNITLLPTSANLTNGSTQQLNAICLDQFGLPIAANISYTSSNPFAATVNATSGLVTGVGLGNATITAICQGARTINTTNNITIGPRIIGIKSISIMDTNLFVLLTVFTLILGLYGFKKYGK